MFYQAHNSVGVDYFNPIIYEDITFLPHLHRHCEVMLVLEGEVRVTVDGKTETARSGDAAIILGNQLHAFSTDGTSRAWVCVFSDDYAGSFSMRMQGKRGERSVFHCPREVMAYFFYIGECGSESEHYSRKALLYMLCSEYARSIPITDGGACGGELLYRIMTYISEHFAENVTLTRLACELGYEPHYLSRCLHRAVSIDLRRLINQYRLSRATELLGASDLTMTEIAEQCGFQSVRNFNRVFLSETGSSPSAYARRRLTQSPS